VTPPTYTFVAIGSDESVPGRPFTDLKHNGADLQALTYLAGRLRTIASSPLPTLPFVIETTGPESRYLRNILCQPAKLLTDDSFFVVGFFGQKRKTVELGPLTQVDDTLVKGLADTPYVVSYSSMQLADGNYGNLVVLSEAGGRESWRESKTHQYAVAELAPIYYESVRLHNGGLWGAQTETPQVSLTSTKYFDYRSELWCGVRELPQ